MGSEGGGIHSKRKLRLFCLHGFRTSGDIIRKQVTGKWPESVLEKLDLVCVDAPFPCQGKSEVEGIFDPPYFEWFQFNKEFSEYQNLDECLAYIEECVIKHGPFDGLLGFSQGAILSAALSGLQANGVCLTKVPEIKFVVIIGGAKFRDPSVCEKAYSSQIQCPSVHFLVKYRDLVIISSTEPPSWLLPYEVLASGRRASSESYRWNVVSYLFVVSLFEFSSIDVLDTLAPDIPVSAIDSSAYVL